MHKFSKINTKYEDLKRDHLRQMIMALEMLP